MKHIIIQAGGKGTRMEHLTANKPKALVSVDGLPLIIRQMHLYPGAHFYIIADYKRDVLQQYLAHFASANFTLIEANGEGTCSGIANALSHIPKDNPLMILWCDLLLYNKVSPSHGDITKNNYIGLSQTFRCRWSFQKGKLAEVPSETHGIAGVYIFRSKGEIEDIPASGEFCRYLQEKNISLRPFKLKGVHEVGTIELYQSLIGDKPTVRPFNQIDMHDTSVVKRPKDSQGRNLAKYEKRWYRKVSQFQGSFIPRIYKYSPLTIERIEGSPLFSAQIDENEKKIVLDQIIASLKQIHAYKRPKYRDNLANNYEAIIGKTKKRLDSIIKLVPDSDADTLIINGKSCINFYKSWDKVEALCQPHLNNRYVPIHGDITFSNIMYSPHQRQVYFIDPRGYYGSSVFYGDDDYDWAKLYYSLVGDYDQFNSKQFRLEITPENKVISIQSNGWQSLENYFFDTINRNKEKIKIFHAIIWLSLASYAWDDFDSIVGAFYKGIYLMQENYERSVSKTT